MLDKIRSNLTTAYEMIKAAGKEYGEDRVARMSAAVAYRAIFALAPLFLVAVFVFGLVLGGSDSARAQILETVTEFAGQEVGEAVENVLGSVEASGNTAGVIGFVLLLWTASSLFMELQNDLNDIFHVPYEHTTGIVAFIRKRGIGFLFALGLGVVLIAVWGLNFFWNLLEGVIPEDFAPIHNVIGWLTPVVSLVVLPFVIALAFQVLSRAKVRWRAVWWGSFFTSAAFLAAAYGASLYFSLSNTSAITIAGSIFIILLLAFVLSTVFLFGAEVTKVHNDYLDTGEITRPNFRADEEDVDAVIGEPEPSVPLAAVFAFLGGLFLGWRRRP